MSHSRFDESVLRFGFTGFTESTWNPLCLVFHVWIKETTR